MSYRFGHKFPIDEFYFNTFGIFSATCIFAYGWFTSSRGVTNDPRLTDFNADLRAMKQRYTQNEPMGHGEKSIIELWKEHKDAIEREKARRAEGSFLAGRDAMEHAGK